MSTARKRIDAAHSTTPNPWLDAIGITALAKSQKPDKQRNLLKVGLYPVSLNVEGKIAGHSWQREITGTLSVAPDSPPVAVSTTPWEELLQVALCEMSAKCRQAFLAKVAAGMVPEPDCGADKATIVAAELEPALAAYRAAHSAGKRGVVSFVHTP